MEDTLKDVSKREVGEIAVRGAASDASVETTRETGNGVLLGDADALLMRGEKGNVLWADRWYQRCSRWCGCDPGQEGSRACGEPHRWPRFQRKSRRSGPRSMIRGRMIDTSFKRSSLSLSVTLSMMIRFFKK